MDSSKKIVRHLEGLPLWYNIEKYEELNKISMSSWYDLLSQRSAHLYFLDSGDFRSYEDNDSTFLDVLLKSRDNPLYELNKTVEAFIFGGGLLDALKHDKSYFNEMSFGISPITLRQLYMIENWYDEDVKRRVRLWADKLHNRSFEFTNNFEFDAETKWVKSFFHDPISESLKKHNKQNNDMSEVSTSYVSIDYSLPDKLLIEQFKQFLTEHRNKYPDKDASENAMSPNPNKWIEYGVLPYLDLKIWERQTGNSIPYRVFADAIFPGGEKGEEMVRKTTKKIADKLVTFEYLRVLATIVAQENRKEKE